ncbi:sigma-70 family RNA polymerase sigma factor [uncultured Maribacter sp.]|uniref:sigma-70 family RNA polymerase sigma factor n=1 Tax=uncultured Maribacter sp. TaxID=431308 RepID=UPI00262D6545|nr:sigma-70 family RNA polymerase sigma factor [uncultured Maribacter sp.]
MNNYQEKLFPYAYNILGTVDNAKDIVQEVIYKHIAHNNKEVKNETGYLVKSVINAAINLKKRNQKIRNTGMWLPEPIATETSDNGIDSKEIISYSMLVLLEKLSAKERAVFILKNGFDYSHKEISEVIDSTVENSRKLLSRAKAKIVEHKPRVNKTPLQNILPIENYIQVIKNGDVTALEMLLSKDILLAADGGRNIKVVRELTTGITATSKLLIYVYRAFLTGLKFKISSVNHQPAVLFYQKDSLYNCQVLELEKMKIKSIYSIVDPKKLKSLCV